MKAQPSIFAQTRALIADQLRGLFRSLGLGASADKVGTPPTTRQRAASLIQAIDAGGMPLNPARVNSIARDMGLEVSKHAPVEDTVARIRLALQRLRD